MCVCVCVLNLLKCNELCVVTDGSLCQNELADDKLPYLSIKCWDRLCVFLHFFWYSVSIFWVGVFATNIILSYKQVFTDTTMI